MFNFFNSNQDTCFESLADCSYYINTDGKFENINTSGLSLLEVDNKSKFLSSSWNKLWKGSDQEKAAKSFNEALSGKVSRFQGSCLTFKDHLKWWDVTLSPIRDYKGRVIKVLSVLRDISEYKHLESHLVHAKSVAEKKNKLKSQFVANVSHELRSPLTSVLGYADLLKSENLDEERRTEYVDRIKRNGEHLLNVLNDILDISKVESGKFNIHKHKFDFKSFIDNILSYASGMSIKQDIRINLCILSELPKYIQSDELRLRQILLNLLSNAIKFSNGKNIDFKIHFQNNKLLFDIIDYGHGMSLDHQKNLFNAYSQDSSLTSKNFAGTGLGLHLSKKLIQELNGEIKLIFSEKDKGSHFRVELPVMVLDKLHEVKPLCERSDFDLSKFVDQKILIVDDAEENRRLVSIYLDTFNIKYDHAKNGQEAVDKCFINDYCVILMDIHMPKLNGLDAAKLILNRNQKAKIIAFTAHATSDEIREILRGGFRDYLSKPFSKTEIFNVLRKVLNLNN